MPAPPTSSLAVVMPEDPPRRLDKALALALPEEAEISRTRIARLIEAGAVARLGPLGREVVTSLKAPVAAGEVWEIILPEPEAAVALPEAIPLDIIHEDDALVVVNKPAGMVVHPAPGASSGTLVNALLHHCGDSLSGVGGVRRPGIVHRIDKDTTGLLVVAKTDAAHQALAVQFARHSVEREYRAVVHGLPDRAEPRLAGLAGVGFEPGGVVRIALPLGRHRTDRQRMAVTPGRGRHAVTRFRVVEGLGEGGRAAALLECRLETGRTHQIRVHLAHVGHPLLGDPVYGSGRRGAGRGLAPEAAAVVTAFRRQALHAATLGFEHPDDSRPMRFVAPLPDDMAGLVAALRGGGPIRA
ncbi:MAG: RluA family pseudouridine synthase [Rhodobacteraceae bacterium]|nr:RluA family pseudouridine synthase [Paracoccaceae bacterium]